MNKDVLKPKSEEEGKGKSKASDGHDREQEPQATCDSDSSHGADNNTILSRIAKSAASLPSALFAGRPGAGELLRIGATQKGESSQPGEGLYRAAESSAQTRTNLPAGESIKPSQAREHIAEEEAAFAAFLDSTSVFQPSTAQDTKELWQPGPSAADVPVPSPRGRLFGDSLSEQEARDGMDIVALLSAHDDPGSSFLQDETVSDGDMNNLREALFGEGSDNNHSPIAWDNVLDFIPGYLHDTTAPSSRLATNELLMHLGTGDQEEAWQTWVGQWSRVLTGYQDEVWGDLGSLVHEARVEVEELEQLSTNKKPPLPTALLRLRAILGHLRGS
ncbi:hypothetical protein B0T25DRAFT_444735 [Lasiosphaeria hispida]|uniref:Uncharacterized protein n=1 Tax=Lasiosphaeria hispida TaxID=260671 RepID=A0AAJ0HUG4_9PEZI|nr:hypothetical protein B0T25DRAFT_444735 [Lasiosphaeria hispida]